MKRLSSYLCMTFCSCLIAVAQQEPHTRISVKHITVDPSGISKEGILTHKRYLQSESAPMVRMSNIKTADLAEMPATVIAGNSFEPDVLLARERKKPIAYITLPTYRISNGRKEKLESFDLEVTEFIAEEDHNNTVAKGTLVNTSILNTGTWYKIKIPKRGIYKIDYAFLQSLGIDPAGVDPRHIRLFGNGGTVLPERADSTQPDDLIENAIAMHANGNTFNPGDYFLFYANGPQSWAKDSLRQRFIHSNNYYEDYSYYFLVCDLGPGKRIPQTAASGTATLTTNTFNDYYADDIDSFNVGGMGKVWWGHRMNSMNGASLNQSFNIALGAVSGPVTLETYVGNTSDAGNNNLRIHINGVQAADFNLGRQGDGSFMAVRSATGDSALTINPGTGNLNVQLVYTPGGNAMGYIDFLRFNYRRQLSMSGLSQLSFRDWKTAVLGSGQSAAFKISDAGSRVKVWEVTNPLSPEALTGAWSGNDYTIVREGNRLREFIAFDSTQCYTPVVASPARVPNQNLHGLPPTDLLIITTSDLVPAANALADFHRQQDHIVVTVATVDKIYNEFSSGSQDIGGIRNFIKMFYDRATGEQDLIKNVLLLGAASYDYKNCLPFNTNIVPVFQTYESIMNYTPSGGAYSSDDFYALLDEGESIYDAGALDIGTGRIPVYSLEEAMKVVDKIKHYVSPASFGPWKNVVSYVADDKDPGGPLSMDHLKDCERVNRYFQQDNKQYNLYKIYSDAFQVVNTPSGARYPAVNKAVNDQVYNGTFLMSYSGHGNPDRWAEEAILTADDYGSWNNKNKLPVIVTATCDFGRFDDPGHRSAGARLMLNPDGGSIAMITTTQIVYQAENTIINEEYTKQQFTPGAGGRYPTLGEALMSAKNATPSSARTNNHKYVVLGDPALRLQVPENQVHTEKLYLVQNGNATATDTIAALGRYKLTGTITDRDGNILTDFNGTVHISIFDKTRSVQTNNKRPGVSAVTASFKLQTNTIAKTRATVTNGRFEVSFIVPKDISYEYGLSKISYYASNDQTDAAGVDTSYTIGGSANAGEDNEDPLVQPYIDNDKFRDGGVTGPNPLLYVKLSDDNGINYSGSAIGHDIVAILDDNVQQPLGMNDYYTPEQDDYRRGYIHFPLSNLPEGKHTIRVKAWDVYNNSGEGVVHFEVKNKASGFISALYNYPNPVEDLTHIVFQHNQNGEQMEVTLQIFNTAGSLVRTIAQHFKAEGNRTELDWDGCGPGGLRLAKGVYFYRLTAKTDKGISATAHQKLVLLR